MQMAIERTTLSKITSDISGTTLEEDTHLRFKISGNGKTWVLDAGMNEPLVQDVLSHARRTQQGRPSNGNGTSN
jgi:hypothetical protein